MEFRLAKTEDSTKLLEIYKQYIHTEITFEYSLPSAEEFAERIKEITAVYPYIVCKEGADILGYAYAHRQMQREAYQWNAELSIYLDERFTSKGIGKILYNMLIDILKLQGVMNVYGGVTVPNIKSEGLHRAMGFKKLGVYHRTGWKNGRWHDVAWYEKRISDKATCPAPILPIGELPQEKLEEILHHAS